jgi:hypothetical protein
MRVPQCLNEVKNTFPDIFFRKKIPVCGFSWDFLAKHTLFENFLGNEAEKCSLFGLRKLECACGPI